MIDSWTTAKRLPVACRRALLSALVLLPLARISLAGVGLDRTRWLLDHVLLPPLLPRGQRPPEAEAISRMTSSAAARLPMKLDCLPRSLVTARLLARLGLSAELKIGIAERGKATGPLEAHAWVEHQGRILDSDPGETERFRAFEAPAAAAPRREHGRPGRP